MPAPRREPERHVEGDHVNALGLEAERSPSSTSTDIEHAPAKSRPDPVPERIILDDRPSEPRVGDAFGSGSLARLRGGGPPLVIERDDGFIDVDASDFFSDGPWTHSLSLADRIPPRHSWAATDRRLWFPVGGHRVPQNAQSHPDGTCARRCPTGRGGLPAPERRLAQARSTSTGQLIPGADASR